VCPSSGDIKRLMMMMKENAVLSPNTFFSKWYVLSYTKYASHGSGAKNASV
jgi:hypothetical protein